jgi:hypothetical protein
MKAHHFSKLMLICCLTLFMFSCEEETTSPKDHSYDPDLATIRYNWSFTSRPMSCDFTKGNINYFMAQDFEMQDVYDDSLLSSKEMDDTVHLLRNELLPDSTGSDNYWSGIMQYLETPINIAETEYIELQILENADVFPDVPVTMHIDLGRMNEDFYKPGENLVPDSEDGIISWNGELDFGEDVGLDQISDGEDGDDPDDNFSNTKININGFEEYPLINGTENNDRLDTEDLDNNGRLDTENAYIEFSVDLDENEFLSSINSKGLRTYQIPADVYTVFAEEGFTPDLANLKYMRIWFEYPEETYVILISLTVVSPSSENTSQNLIIPELPKKSI